MSNIAEQMVETVTRTEITAREISQVFMSPEVEMAKNNSLFQYLITEKTTCGIVIRFKTAEELAQE